MNLDSVRIDAVQAARGRTSGMPAPSQDAPPVPFAQALSGASAQPQPDRAPTQQASERPDRKEPSENSPKSEDVPEPDRPAKATAHSRHSNPGKAQGSGEHRKAAQASDGAKAAESAAQTDLAIGSTQAGASPADSQAASKESSSEPAVATNPGPTPSPPAGSSGALLSAVSCAPPGLAEQMALASGALQEPDETDTAAQDIPGREASNDLRPSTSRHRGPAAEPAGWRSAASGLAAPSDAPQRSLDAIKTPGSGTEHSALLALQERSNDRIPESLQPASTAFAGTLKSLIAAGEAPSTSAPTPNIPVTVAVSDPRFGHALGDRISWMVKEGLQTAELTLNPPELGPIRVALSLEGDSAHFGFQATHVETRAAIEQALPRLRELLSEQGLKLGDAAVGSHADQQARSGEHRGPGASRSGRPGTGLDDADPRQDEPARSQPMRHRGIGRIDLFV